MTPPTEEAIPAGGDTILGRVIAGNFRIERLIGSGAMGNVYQAEQLSLGKEVAVKVLHPHLMNDEKLVHRFQREAKSASRLNHPNSIQIIDSGRDLSGAFYIAMEFLAGRDLSEVIRDEFPLPLPRMVRIMSQVFAALDEAHAQGVIHRDLKPGNIMLIERRGEPDFVKVCDYGIAKAQLEEGQADSQMLTVQGLVCGTPEYMSPEQARGESLDGRTDLYSAAVILYQMVTGDIPFRAGTPIGIVSRHLSEAPVVPSARRPDPGIPADLDDLILRGLAKSRELRPASAAIFREELESIGAGRVGRRARGDQETVPAVKAITDAGQTMSMAAAEVQHRTTRKAKPLVLGVLLAVGAVLAATAFLRREKPPELGGTVVSSPSPAAPALPQAATEPAAAPVTANAAGAPSASTAAMVSSGDAPGAPFRLKNRHAGPLVRINQQKRESGHPAAATSTTTAMAPSVGTVDGAPGSPHVTTMALTAAPAETKSNGASTAPASADNPGARASREMTAEADSFLAQGDVTRACQRGEDAKKSGQRLAAVYKFLGKCYMRAGDPARAKENYRRYLELAPDAPDAMFIQSIVK